MSSRAQERSCGVELLSALLLLLSLSGKKTQSSKRSMLCYIDNADKQLDRLMVFALCSTFRPFPLVNNSLYVFICVYVHVSECIRKEERGGDGCSDVD